jgi:hypothetical protein
MKPHTFMTCLMLFTALPMTLSANTPMAEGVKIYFKECKKCHGSGVKGAAMQSQLHWDILFDNGGAELVRLHRDTNASKYFNSSRFRVNGHHLHRFLRHYASDSGNVPVCD